MKICRPVGRRNYPFSGDMEAEGAKEDLIPMITVRLAYREIEQSRITTGRCGNWRLMECWSWIYACTRKRIRNF